MAPRKQFDLEHMKAAVNAVRNKEMGSFKAARVFNVPQTTLERYVKSNKPVDDAIKTKIGRKSALPPHIEDDLARYCVIMEENFFGLTRNDVRRMAYQLAVRNGIKTPFSDNTEQAGWKWLNNFLKRNPQLSVRAPEGLSVARVKGFNVESVSQFFDIYETALEKIQHNPSRVYNCDETGVTVVQHKHSKVVGLKGKRQIATLQSAERGALTTVVTCMNPVGHFIPPLLIFPRKNMKQELMEDTPLGSIYACHPSGWIQMDLFTQWFRHFIQHVKPSAEDPVVLVLDGHFSHTRNIDVINLARENHVVIVSLPPHTTHKLQPLDVSFMGPFKTYYAQEVEQWLRNNPGRVVTVYQIGKLFGKAYLRAATAEIAASGFRKTGLFPCNRSVLRPHDFLAGEEIDNSELPSELGTSTHVVATLEDESISETSSVVDRCRPARNEVDSMPGPSSASQETPSMAQSETPGTRNTNQGPTFIKASDISPPPSLKKQFSAKSSRGRSTSAKIITSSPYKESLMQSKGRIGLKPLKSASNPKAAPKGKPRAKRAILVSSSESEDETNITYDDSDDDVNCIDEQDAECLFCSGLFSEDHEGEDWIRCCLCLRWAHALCAGDSSEKFSCDFCLKKQRKK